MERHVPVAIREVDDVGQQRRGELGKGLQVLAHFAGPGRLLAGHPEPFPQDQAAAGQLGEQAEQGSVRTPLASTHPHLAASGVPLRPQKGREPRGSEDSRQPVWASLGAHQPRDGQRELSLKSGKAD